MKKYIKNFEQLTNEAKNEKSESSEIKFTIKQHKIEKPNKPLTLDLFKKIYADGVSVLKSMTEDDFKDGVIHINNQYLDITITKV